ncbi:putative phycobilin:C-phycoerythrin II lyase [Synechococcus sp. BIOS-U3-1]|uniref:HEAT repeat domain-containing protein n=1 Tax=Synechococcus sp. BIOS-U3-1 TaxID=1400865 RepID=UPI0003B01AE0|nr:HEAT repeat domain-containing protein [Synechococcus sp. BIOS-U3-1]AGW21732.1 putative phycoerythrobilin:phycoerythrin II lyase [Synechococcus sp. BIOS-U3-1]QNI57476.1 putative phycobilin:C-phycoerythrin II lyase [Synechococcus sp. BIOS-U3-1]
MSERFDVLFAGLPEEKAIELLKTNPEDLKNPVEKYTAATRLAACQSDESLDALIEAIGLEQENLFNRITRRKVLEALGRRRDSRALPGLFSALAFDDEPSVINAVDSIAQIGSVLDEQQRKTLLNALEGSDNQKRSVIQAHARLGINEGDREISVLEQDANPLVAGAARAYAAKVHGRIDRLQPLIPQLTDPIAGRRRSAVIDLGDAGERSVLKHLVTSPVSMPLRAKSAFQIVDPEKTGLVPEPFTELITSLLQDNPMNMAIQQEWICESSVSEIEKNLQHRDEGKQYGGALTLLNMPSRQQLDAIDRIHDKFWSDYGANYLLTAVIGLKQVHERSDLVRTALAETLPQYAKSRVAAAWACLSLELNDQMELLQEIQLNAKWLPLKWSCEQVLKQMS